TTPTTDRLAELRDQWLAQGLTVRTELGLSDMGDPDLSQSGYRLDCNFDREAHCIRPARFSVRLELESGPCAACARGALPAPGVTCLGCRMSSYGCDSGQGERHVCQPCVDTTAPGYSAAAIAHQEALTAYRDGEDDAHAERATDAFYDMRKTVPPLLRALGHSDVTVAEAVGSLTGFVLSVSPASPYDTIREIEI
ncbi:MAG: hypothetical protein M3N43_07800, partial [Actinomycetota bacterium]|nr:hypothetical protein [Actinomycetota bacterium]